MINSIKSWLAAGALVVLVGCGESAQQETAIEVEVKPRGPNDIMVVVNRPNNLNVVDLATHKVTKVCPMPGRMSGGTVTMGPSNKTAYILSNGYGALYGVDINTCEMTFQAELSQGNIRGRSMAAIAVSLDESEIYTVANRAEINKDHYKALDSQFMVFKTADGRGAKPFATYTVPRRINIIATGFNGKVYMSGDDIYEIDPATGEYSIKLASHSATRPLHSPHDILTVWPIGNVSNEFIRMYSTAKFTDETYDMNTAELLWGFEKIDLTTGETEVKDFGRVDGVLFTGMHRPGHPDEFYQVLTQLKRNKVSEQKIIKSVDLDRSYYCINFSSDGSKIYLAGTLNDIAVYDADTLEKIDNIYLPGGDMSLGTPYIFAASEAK